MFFPHRLQTRIYTSLLGKRLGGEQGTAKRATLFAY